MYTGGITMPSPRIRRLKKAAKVAAWKKANGAEEAVPLVVEEPVVEAAPVVKEEPVVEAPAPKKAAPKKAAPKKAKKAAPKKPLFNYKKLEVKDED
jgi:hypothetical protein